MSTTTVPTDATVEAGAPVLLAVSYLRVSTREQAERGGTEEGFSIPAQPLNRWTKEPCARAFLRNRMWTRCWKSLAWSRSSAPMSWARAFLIKKISASA